MTNDHLYDWACTQFKKFDGNVDRQEKYALIIATSLQTKVLGGLSAAAAQMAKLVVRAV